MTNADEFRKRCKGIVPVQYCPYTKDGELDLDGLKKNTEFLVDFARNGERDVVITSRIFPSAISYLRRLRLVFPRSRR